MMFATGVKLVGYGMLIYTMDSHEHISNLLLQLDDDLGEGSARKRSNLQDVYSRNYRV